MGLMVWSMVMGVAMAYAQQVLLTLKLKRKTALLALMPLMPLFLYLPWLPSSCHVRTIVSMSLLWIGPSKLLLLGFDRPLDPLPWISSSFLQFCVSSLLPIRISSSSSPPSSSSSSSPYAFFLKLILLVAILNTYPLFPSMPPPLLYLLYCIHFYLGLELAFGTIAALVSVLFATPLHAPFNQPYLAESLTDFWGRRWNLTAHSLLKATVYRPVLAAMAGKGDTARAAGAVATFAVSGAMHEVIYVYVSKSRATGEMAAFFLVHGAATIAEAAMSKHVQAVPLRLRRALTLSFVYVTASFFFLRPLRRSGTDADSIAEYHRLQSAFVSLLKYW